MDIYEDFYILIIIYFPLGEDNLSCYVATKFLNMVGEKICHVVMQ